MLAIASALFVFWFLVFGDAKKIQSHAGVTIKLDRNNSVDPGPCSRLFHGRIKLIKDRLGEDRTVICSEERNVFFWKPLDGSATVGEYFDPAHHCSDVVDRVSDASDGFYWIKMKNMKKAVKVWCDVTTDGGGFMLVAKKNSAVTWSVPSTKETVSPKGNPHWSSVLGDAEMLDFRIKFSTTDDFKDTKADWSFRLNNKRRFDQLLVRDKGGCTKHNPGIGDIAFVKDLQTGQIVNTNFQCSLFSGHLSDAIGWGMMNKCLRKSCPLGFAFFPGINVKLDDSGSFSYSAHNNSAHSGIMHSSTAFIGCAHGKCCACFGPKGGTNNYCLDNCTSINGGKVIKNVHTWIWIRSTLPKRVWKNCIEYTVRGAHGKDEKYKINQATGVPEKGGCSNPGEITHNNAVVVVPEKNAIKKIPPVAGLLLYSPENQELFVQGKGKWNKIAMEKQDKSKQQQLKKYLHQLKSELQLVNNTQQQIKGQLQQIKSEQHQIKTELRQTKSEHQQMKTEQLTLKKQIQALNSTNGISSCKELKNRKSGLSNGYYQTQSFKAYCDMSNNGWTLVARFSNKDSKNWITNSKFWYDRSSDYGFPTSPSDNSDMISEAFWRVRGNEIKITRSDDSSHTALLQTTSNCLGSATFRSKITSYGNYRNRAVWASDQCRGSCRVSYGGQYQSTAGFEMYSCNGNIQSNNYIGFWCDWSSGDGAVMMIGGGGGGCYRADHGIGITEENEAKFGAGRGYDFGSEGHGNMPSSYSLNLWVR